MIVGFNHNVLYLGVGFHVQTEDGGLKSPSLVTLLYHGGIIVSSQKTSYADILSVDNLNQVVEDLAKEQHKGMLRRLTKGEFDQRIRDLGIAIEGEAPVQDKNAVEPEVPPEAAQVLEEVRPVEDGKSPVVEEATTADEEADAVYADAVDAVDEGNEPWLGEELEELEPVPLELPVAGESRRESAAPVEEPEPEAEPAAAMVEDDLPTAIEPAYEPPSAEDRDTRQDVSEALDDLIFSYLTGGDEKD